MKQGANSFDPPVGLIRSGSIVGYDVNTNTLQVALTGTSAIQGKAQPVSVPGSFPYIDSNGLFVGSLPAKNTPVAVAQASGGKYYFVSYAPENPSIIPDLNLGELLIFSSDTSKMTLNQDSHIKIGSDVNNVSIFAGSQQFPKSNYITINFENENHFNQSYREVGGTIKRDIVPNPQASSFTGNTKLEDDDYDNQLILIGLDPTSTSNDLLVGSNKNPPLVEHRQMFYEFQPKSHIDADTLEAGKYLASTTSATTYGTPNRRSSRSDTMSLSLVAPNFLIEEVKGTVVDIFGNILDINRIPIPVGMSATTTLRNNGTTANTNPSQAYQNIRALERKGIAYHFELNARKDPNPFNQGSALTINDDNYNAKLQRSRFSFDVDKEGQIKVNIPASSESGNIPLLTRAENYSTFATTDNNNPNQLWFVQSAQNVSQDIFVDSFAAPMKTPSSSAAGFDTTFAHGSITLQDNTTSANLGPTDRISQFPNGNISTGVTTYNIKHGTAYHDILQTCSVHQNNMTLSYPTGAVDSPDLSYITNLTNVVSDTITIGSVGTNGTPTNPNGNAGGRSGSINFDGSMEFNFGANTVDRQSLWVDTAGGAVVNLGRDVNQRSLVMGMDGDAYVQIGGYGVAGDARFTALGQDGLHNGVLDIRIFNSGFVNIIRVDQKGMVLMSPGRIAVHAGQGMTLTSDSDIEIECETLTIQQRGVNKVFGGSI
jgi:phage gp45-like